MTRSIIDDNGAAVCKGMHEQIQGRLYCSIQPNGIVTPCVYMPIEVGDLRTERFMYNISSIPELNALMLEHSLIVEHKDAMKGMTLAEFEIKFTRTFDAGIPIPPCSPYEGHYCGKPRSMVMLEVSGFYNFFGMRMNQEEALREGKEEKLKGYLLAQKDFLDCSNYIIHGV